MNSGFTVAETLAVIVILSIMMMLFPMQRYECDSAERTFMPDYLLAQTAAMAQAQHTQLPAYDGYPDVGFNEKGNVNRAMTFSFQKTGKTVVIELGGGRLVFR